MASSKLKKQIESIKNIGGDKEERKINNPFIEEGGDNNQIILKSFSNLSSSSLLSSSSQTLPFHSTTVVSSFNNNSSSVSVQTSSIANNNYLIPYCDNTSEFVNSSIILKDNSSSGETKSPLLPLRQKDTSGSGESNSSIKLNSSSSYTTKSSSSQISSSTQLDSSSLPEEFNSSISSNSSKTSSSIKSSAPNNSSTPQPSSSPSSTVTFVPRRRPRHISGIGGGRVRILGVHSEPGSFALEESPLEEEELLVFNKSEGENKIKLEEQQISSKQRSHNFKGRRQLSAMSSLYRQATIGAAAASVFNSTATTVANALEFVSNVEQQHPNVPPPPHNSRSESPTNNSSGSVSDNSWSPGGNRAMRKLKKEAPNLQQCTTSSEEGSQIDFSSPSISRTNSAQSIPVPIKSVSEDDELSPYEKTIKMLANDLQCQKELALGKRVGFYRLGKELGAGNFSKVKLGVHVLTKEKVAVKTMEKGKMDQKAQRVLNREIDNMELLHHPNIIRLFEVVATLSKVHLVMEYAGGGELYTYVHDNGKLTEEVAKPIFAQIVSAVAHLHSKNICHRDIKAENVFLSHPGWIKLGDFGFSCNFEEDSFLNTFCGSPPYAAPELFRDQKYIGPMVDIWAMGILLYFMLVGVTPFRGETVSDLKRNILEGVYYMPDYVSTFAQHSITRMLELDAKRRANILELKRTYWLSECKFPDSYVNLSLNPNEHSLAHCKLERLVWSQLQIYGITEEMLRSVAKSKGARNPVIGTYRITLYQCQAIDRDKERAKLNEHLLQLAEKNSLLSGKIDERSKACTII